jgi:hypothetical protein
MLCDKPDEFISATKTEVSLAPRRNEPGDLSVPRLSSSVPSSRDPFSFLITYSAGSVGVCLTVSSALGTHRSVWYQWRAKLQVTPRYFVFLYNSVRFPSYFVALYHVWVLLFFGTGLG